MGQLVRNKKLLIIEDDSFLREGIALSLSEEMIVYTAATKKEGRIQLQEKKPDILILDMNLPDGTGLELCQELRQTSNIPVIFLTVNNGELETISAFRVGATDYVTKPFSMMILIERIKAALRRDSQQNHAYMDAEFYFNFEAFDYQVKDQRISLSPVEQKLLKTLVENKGIIISRDRLVEIVWSCEGVYIDDNALTVSIKRLRAKIGTHAIRTVYGIGYVWHGGDV